MELSKPLMNKTVVSLSEFNRLEDLHAYEILDTPPEQDFDDLVDLAAMICSCPTSMISLIDEDRQWFKAKIGIEDSGSSRDLSICSHAIQQDDVFIVENAIADERFLNSPMVTGGIRLRFYAGAPIYSSGGHKLGTLCVIDKRSKTLLPKQIEALKKLSRQVTKLLELRMKNRQLEKMISNSGNH